MSGLQEINGKAYEYAILVSLYLVSLYNELSINTNNTIKITENAPYNRAKECFNTISENEQQIMLNSANKGIKHIVDSFEPMIKAPSVLDTIILSIQPDQKGSEGDVRDIVMVKSGLGWEFGISAKHNSISIKSPRLSRNNDFFSKFGITSSTTYKEAIETAFHYVDQNKGKIWQEQGSDKQEKHYLPLLSAVVNELKAQISTPNFAKNLMLLIIGNTDHYRVSLKRGVVK